MDDESLARHIRGKLLGGLLPMSLPRSTWGGTCKQASICAGCDEPIAAGALEIEADCVDGIKRMYHVRCHQILESARLELGQNAEPA